MQWGIPVFLAILPLAAQAPPGWDRQGYLGSEMPGTGAWSGAGFWAGDRHGPAPTLVDSLGLGNALTGGGFHLEGGFRGGHWDLAAEVLGNRDTLGQAYLTLYRSHLWYRGERGWQGGFEQEPMVWGYGLNGGYLLGEATGGEAITTTAKLELDLGPRLASATWIVRGFRPFRDNLADWLLDHPGQTPGKDRFTGVQQTLDFQAGRRTTLGLGAAWQREQAVLNVTGQSGNGFAWFADVTFRWPARS